MPRVALARNARPRVREVGLGVDRVAAAAVRLHPVKFVEDRFQRTALARFLVARRSEIVRSGPKILGGLVELLHGGRTVVSAGRSGSFTSPSKVGAGTDEHFRVDAEAGRCPLSSDAGACVLSWSYVAGCARHHTNPALGGADGAWRR